MKTLYCSAPGRICLFGDHMDWCGHQVITAAINKRIFLEGRLNGTSTINLRSFTPFRLEERFEIDSFKLDVDSDFRYVRGVVKAYQEADIPYLIEGMDLQFYKLQ